MRVAAKAGFLSKRIWMNFFATGNRRWQNRRWKSLRETGLFKPVPDYGFTESTVALSDKGKSLASALGMNSVYSPGAKNLWHDEELVRFALFLERHDWISDWMTEQELKGNGQVERFFQSQGRVLKIPDLIIEWNGSPSKTFWAVELERTRKEFNRYYDMVGAYKGISRIDSVLVITATSSIEANIKKAQAKMGYPQSQRPMLFASLNEVIQDPASSELRHGQNRITLEKMAHALTGKKMLHSASDGKRSSPDSSPGGASPKQAS
jgi:hypothetical protein